MNEKGWRPDGPIPLRDFYEVDFARDTRGCYHYILQNVEDELWHFVRGSRKIDGKYPIDEGRKIADNTNNASIIGSNKKLVVAYTDNSGRLRQQKAPYEDFKDPSQEEHPVSRLPIEWTYPYTKQYVAPILMPAIGLSMKYTNEEVEVVAERIARERLGNCVRCFFALAGWESFTVENMRKVYVEKPKGYDLNLFNPDWIEQLSTRVKYFTDRGIFVIITIIDNSSLHNYPNGGWNAHPWNRKNNINRKEDGTQTAWDAITVYHYYEHPENPHAVYTGEFIKAYVQKLPEIFEDDDYSIYLPSMNVDLPLIGYQHCNEGHAGSKYHWLNTSYLREKGVHEKWRIFTSLIAEGFYKKRMDHLIKEVHKINSIESYEERKNLLSSLREKFVASGDGPKPPNSKKDTKELLKHVLGDGQRGIEYNFRKSWHWTGEEWVKKVGQPLNAIPWDWLEAVGEAWEEHLSE